MGADETSVAAALPTDPAAAFLQDAVALVREQWNQESWDSCTDIIREWRDLIERHVGINPVTASEETLHDAVHWEAIRLHARNCVGAVAATACRLPGSTVPSIGHTATAHLDEARQRLTQGKGT